jgi:hypothetical protein
MWTVCALFLNQVLADIIGAGMSPSGGVLHTAWLGLYIAPTTPITPQSTMLQITEATYDGYARQEIVWYPPYTDMLGPQTLTGQSLLFTPTDSTVPNMITGLFISSALTAGTLWMAQALASPGYPLQMVGESLVIVPQFQLGYLQVYGGAQIVS